MKSFRPFSRSLIVSASLLIMLIAHGLTFPPVTMAQSGTTGSLSGVVQDPNGAVLPGVQVTIRSTGTGLTRTGTTNDEGRWTFPALPVGTYELTYEVSNFKTLKRSNVEVEASVPRTFEDRLEVAGVSGETVTVVEGGAALATPDTSAVARQLSAEQLVSVPTSTRSFTQLLSAEAGVSADLSPVLTNGNGNLSPSVNGTRTTSTSLSFNGVDATNITSNEGSLNDNIAPAPETLSGGQAPDLSLRRLDRTLGRRQLPAHHQERHQRVPRLGLLLPPEREVQRQRLLLQQGRHRPTRRRAATKAASPSAAPSSKTASSSSAATSARTAVTGFVPTASQHHGAAAGARAHQRRRARRRTSLTPSAR